MQPSDMQVVIPMSGFGERFRRAGHTVPKPLIEAEGKPIIAHVVDLFPGVSNVTFICNRDHLDTPQFRLAETLSRYCPGGNVVAIDPHELGPLHAVLQVADRLGPDCPTVVNYCDFTCYWDFEHFCAFVDKTGCDGAIPSYTGFHPHMLGSTSYAYVRHHNLWVEDIQEKQPYTDTPQSEYASSGTYYFKDGATMQHYFQRTVDEDLALNGEYYVSLVYKPMLADGLQVAVYGLQHFMQWGTPHDLAEYKGWSAAFRKLATDDAPPARQAGTVMVPMAGLGSRFAREGYADPKPLISVSGKPMAVQAAADLPEADRRVFILRNDLAGRERVAAALKAAFADTRVVTLDGLTEGQACTCLEALDEVADGPLTIGACDNGMLYDHGALQRLLDEPDADVVVWVARGHPEAVRYPEMYGWVEADAEGKVHQVSVKKPLSDPATNPVVVGAFTFKDADVFRTSTERMIANDSRVNGEFYIDTCINDAVALGYDCRIFEIDNFLCWGTPDDLRTFEYWQSCFHKWDGHPYRLQDDRRVDPAQVAQLAALFAKAVPELPGERP
jgi:NDP-sugar pyrophosphorylase family protein